MKTKNRVIVRILAASLSIITIITMVFAGSAQSTPISQSTPIYYSDLFYGYSPEYLKSQKLLSYAGDNSEVMLSAFNDFLDSGDSTWMEIKTAVNSATNLIGFIQLVSDGFANTDYNYNNALDSANEAFVKELLSNSIYISADSNFGTGTKIYKKAKDITSVYEQFRKNFSIEQVTYEELLIEYYEVITESGIFQSLSVSQLQIIKEILPNLKKLNTAFDTGAKVLEAAGALTVALLIEDVRMEIIDDIISCEDGSGYLYDGMTRLKSQLSNGWVSYFISNYVTDTVLSELSGLLVKTATSSISAYGFVTAILKVASWITFDLIFDVPDMQDVLTQQTLANYERDLYSIILGKYAGFFTQFKSDDIFSYESIFSAYMAVIKAGLSKTEDILIDSNKNIVSNVRKKYKDFSYESYIEDIKETISGLSTSEIKYRPVTDWNLSLPLNVHEPSDTIESNSIYIFNGAFNGNLILKGDGVINCNSLAINGNLTSNGCLKFNETALTVNGDVVINAPFYMQNEDDYLLVNGDFTVGGSDVSTDHLSAGTIEIKGDFTQTSGSCRNYYESGTHQTIFSGTETQTISFGCYSGTWYNQFENLVLQNTDICFATPIHHLTVRQDTVITNENPISFVEYLELKDCSFTVSGPITAPDIIINNATLNNTGDFEATSSAVFNGNVTINGDVSVCGLQMQNEDDYLLVNGDFTVGGSDVSTDHLSAGTIEIKGDFTQTSGSCRNYYESGTHQTIFSGTETQTISFGCYSGTWYNQFENLVLQNTDICFATPIKKLTLCQDTVITNEQPLVVQNTLDLNGYILYAAGSVSYGNLIENGGKIVPYCYFNIEKVEKTPATCTESGTAEYWVCEECGIMYSDIYCQTVISEVPVISAFGHTVENSPYIAPTCCSLGYTEGTICSVCKTSLSGREEIAKLPHADVNSDGLCDGCDKITNVDLIKDIYISIATPETRTISYMESIKLYVNVVNLPEGYKIKWKVEGDGVEIKPSALGQICTVTSTSTGNVVIKAYIVDSKGNTVTDKNGKQVSDSEYFYSEANLWLRIVYFFKKLFGISVSTAQAFKGII